MRACVRGVVVVVAFFLPVIIVVAGDKPPISTEDSSAHAEYHQTATTDRQTALYTHGSVAQPHSKPMEFKRATRESSMR